ncbi:MAG: CDP-glycerol glycerophosphotransferase family protein [Bacteroidales bacterium]|jgi:hypothetical protein|nr:CDP-glycerol glycerophosphotransferase family protein [Bacteroidales bacterium]
MQNNGFFLDIILRIKGLFAISFIDSMHKILIYKDFFRITFPVVFERYIKTTRKKQKKNLENIKRKSTITVAFFLQTPSTWKYDALYNLLAKAKRFHPVVVICPFNVHLNYSNDECHQVMKMTEQFAIKKQYNYVTTCTEETGKWRDIKKELSPDVVFFTKPYKDTLPQYYIYNFREKITCYVPYGIFSSVLYRHNLNLPFHNLLYHFFIETEDHKEMATQYSSVKGDNVIVSGNLGMESIMDKSHTPINVWKRQEKPKKRIIWAPHHTIDYMFNFSNFLSYCDSMIEVAKKYENEIQFAFKPHPVLKFRLINLWGNEKTEKYYNLWKDMSNTQLEEGYYNDLFETSDAMIHDSVSFTIEYLHTVKPVLYTIREEKVKKQWNPFSVKAFNLHYHAHNEEEIEEFITKVVLEGEDAMRQDREVFFNSYLYPKDGIMPSKKIMQILEEDLS